MNEELRDEVAGVLGEHRVNFHSRNVGGDTASELRYTSCDGCDWLGGHHDEAGWETHIADALMPLLERREREAAARAWDEGYRTCADDAGGDRWWAETPNPYRADAITNADASTEETA